MTQNANLRRLFKPVQKWFHYGIFFSVFVFCFSLCACHHTGFVDETNTIITGAGEGGDIPDSQTEYPSTRAAVINGPSSLGIQSSNNYRGLNGFDPFIFRHTYTRSGNYQQEDSIINLGEVLMEDSQP